MNITGEFNAFKWITSGAFTWSDTQYATEKASSGHEIKHWNFDASRTWTGEVKLFCNK